ncbi:MULTISPECIES: bifunctional UDP-sugar hydrolase/5'-nucleotidase [unclassified Collinsella]|uniref:bifunctional metallophosphatase/5'-nucleotidase n=1 Tax=unclassified Collinsella TaxID=2637548 RepID=UPI000E53A5B0|nr:MULTISPECIES: 5'-nucleotidase C-terminal domain-containing protein [unclassified Collinsella]RHJ40723.1 bifunctional metallophosphatase/5'-nucleotidase [Collinsella sp. AM10-48]RHJ41707.1 bifunctional metallophosphatase/5'-nucleotidase [Collinsella sp. AM10-32]RHJ46443.1 bifunctional metallophosphatase/5'-nucleotidase [Collinsella sp. AM10-27]RHJ46911.1 bifunctional metallophosphatase/5'-nucleotidase [Collinsella sp. AM10-26]RHJ55946.1 bifunctional metallophosphatase/5'-nucleotidase [Collin
MKRFVPRLALTAALLAGVFTGAPSLALASDLPQAINDSVTVIHTNDIHGSYKYSYNASKGTGTVGFDGLAVLYSAQGNAPDLLLDAGDTFHGQSFATMSEGKSIAELMDTFYADGYDATTPGNHDWSYGADKLRTMTGHSTTGTPFAMLCANATSSNGIWSSSITKTLNRTWKDGEDSSTFNYKIKVGVVGAMDESLGSSLRADLVAGTSFSSAANAINAEAEQLRKEGCDVVVCIAHTLDAKTFATRLRGVDALIAGHEHINLNEKVTGADGKTIHVVEAGSAFAEVGLLSVPYEHDTKGTESTDDDTVAVYAGKSDEKLYTAKDVNVLLTDPNKGSTYQSILDEVSNNKIKPLDDAFSAASSEVLGTSSTNYFYGEDAAGTHGWEMVRTTDFRPSKKGDTTKTQTIGHVICGSYLDLTGADLAIENAGGIRGGIAAGDVTAGNVIAISPYGNTVETWTMTGADFLAALEHSLQISDECNHSYELQQAYVAAGHTEQEAQDMYKWRDDSGSVLSFGGINVTIDWTQSEGKRIVSATLTKDGSTLDPAKTYTVATNNYIITNTTDFPTFANATKHTEWGTCESALRALIGQNSWESKMASLAGTISFGSAAVGPTPTPAPAPEPSPQTDTTTTKVITKKTTGKLAATGDRTLAMVGACLIGGIVIIILGIIWKRRR